VRRRWTGRPRPARSPSSRSLLVTVVPHGHLFTVALPPAKGQFRGGCVASSSWPPVAGSMPGGRSVPSPSPSPHSPRRAAAVKEPAPGAAGRFALFHMLVGVRRGIFDPPAAGLAVPWSYLATVASVAV